MSRTSLVFVILMFGFCLPLLADQAHVKIGNSNRPQVKQGDPGEQAIAVLTQNPSWERWKYQVNGVEQPSPKANLRITVQDGVFIINRGGAPNQYPTFTAATATQFYVEGPVTGHIDPKLNNEQVYQFKIRFVGGQPPREHVYDAKLAHWEDRWPLQLFEVGASNFVEEWTLRP